MATITKYRRPSYRCPHCSWPITRAQNPLGKTLDRALDGDPATDENGLALIAALRAFDKRLALRWLAMPCNVNMLDDRGVTPLMVAAYRGYNDICQILLSLGADAQHSVERYYFEYDSGDRGQEEVARATTHARMGKDEETIDFIVRSEVKARWADLQFGRAEDPSMFDYCGPGLLAEAASLGMLAQCAEMYEAGITIDPNDGCVREALFDAVNDRSIRTSLIMSALGADLGDLGSEGLFSYDFIQALEKEKIRIQEEWKAEDEATRLQMEKRRTAMATDNPQPSVDRSRPALPEIVEGWQRVNAHLTQSEVQGLLGNPPPQPTPAVYDAPDYDWQGHPNELDEPSKEPVNATKSEAMSVQWVSARFAEAVEIAKRMAIQQGEEIHLRRLSDGWGIPNCREPLAEPGLFPEIADGPEPTAIGLAPPDWEDGSPDEVNVEHYGSYSHSLDVD